MNIMQSFKMEKENRFTRDREGSRHTWIEMDRQRQRHRHTESEFSRVDFGVRAPGGSGESKGVMPKARDSEVTCLCLGFTLFYSSHHLCMEMKPKI